ncbi:hypothetical protein [Shimia abyssi]|uniref:Uncharacterized protein n=1 Tax=Shimia abyssi TaxID=1662395 RepID=A0A2P8F1Z4_9RHOB|nr:hypothetical protein [Shimia abyssi]PSL15719.1 hypothetical protein CLV88_12435 [Shimia abyssi]
MKKDDLAGLLEISLTVFEASQAKLHPILKEEMRLRDLLADLSQDAAVARLSFQTDLNMRAVRADEAWNTWAEQNRRTLNLKLAQILAQKEVAMASVKKSFGKLEALRAISAVAKKESEARLAVRNSDAQLQAYLTRVNNTRTF